MFEKFKELTTNSKFKLSAKCYNYNNVDDVWSFGVKSCQVKGDSF